MSDRGVNLAEARKLVFANLVNGVPVPRVMEAFGLSEKEVSDIFAFVSTKLRSYRFERAMPFVACDTIRAAQQNRMIVLVTLERLNLATDARYPKIITTEFVQREAGRMSDAEIALMETRLKARKA